MFDGFGGYTKPAPWPVTPSLSAAPGLWRGARLVLPFWQGGTQHDLSPQRRTVTTIGAPAFTPTARGPALDFNGTSDGLSVPMDFTSNHIALTAVLRWDNNGTNRLFAELSSNYNNVDNSFLLNGGAASGTLISGAIQSSIGTSKYRVETASKFTVGALHTVTFILDNSTTAGDIRIWRDGVELSTGLGVSDKDQSGVFATDTLYIMHRGAASLWADGALLFFVVHDRQIADDEIQALHADPFVMLRRREEFAPILLGGSLSTTVTGTGAATLPAITAAGAGVREVPGTGAATLPALTAAGAGLREIAGTGALSLPALTAAGVGLREIPGAGAATLPALTASGSGSLAGAIIGTGALSLPALIAAGAGLREVTGAGAATLPAITASGATSTSGRRIPLRISASPNAAAIGGSQNSAAVGGSKNRVQ